MQSYDNKSNRHSLFKYLYGQEEKEFWSDVFGIVILKAISENEIRIKWQEKILVLNVDGSMIDGERSCLFPSKECRDWEAWYNEHKIITYDDVTKDLFARIKPNFFIGAFDYDSIKQVDCFSDTSCPLLASSQKQLMKILAINKLMNVQRWIEGNWVPSSDECVYSFIYNNSKLDVVNTYSFAGLILFNSKKNAERAIEILGKEEIKLALSFDW